ncbi:MAG TPA: methyltransferase domain-containing protein [Candidatus Hydrogenedentes bacterium]|nr:methyltransferase domain-containing protein [Candidatus Hydrogenedentota bacterium]
MPGSGNSPASINYDILAPRYDRHRTGEGPYLGALVQCAQSVRANTVLELGAGTGNVSTSFSESYPCALTCIDRSMGMIETALAKDAPGRWLCADALDLPFGNGAFDFIYSVFMIHHIEAVDALMKSCARLSSGAAAFVTTTHEFIEQHPMNAYFPSFARLDKARFQSVDAIARAMQDAGFSRVHSEIFRATPTPIDQRYVAKVSGRFISTYELIPDEEFKEGLARLEHDIGRFGALPNPIAWECACISGYR